MSRLNPMTAMNSAKQTTMIHALALIFEFSMDRVTPFCRVARPVGD